MNLSPTNLKAQKRSFRLPPFFTFIVVPIVLSLTVLLVPNITVDFSPGEPIKWMAVLGSFGLFFIGGIILGNAQKSFCILSPALLSLNFILISVGISEEEFLLNNQIGYRPWLLIFDLFIFYGAIIGLIKIKPKRLHSLIGRALFVIIPFSGILVIGLFSGFFAPNPTYAFIGIFALVKFLAWYLLFLVIFANNTLLIKDAIWGMALFVLIQLFFGISQALGFQVTERLFGFSSDTFFFRNEVIRVGGTLGRATLESVLVLTVPILFAFAVSLRYSRQKVLALISAVSGMALVFLTGSRGPIIATIIGTAVSTGVITVGKLKKKHILYSTVLVVLTVTGIAFTLSTGELEDTLLRNTYSYRLQSFRLAIDMTLDQPLTGVGLNNYLIAGPSYGMSEEEILFGRPVHNQFLLISAETGLIGLSFFVLLLGAWWHLAKIAKRYFLPNQNLTWFPQGALGSLVAFVISAIFDAPLSKGPVLFPLAIIIAGATVWGSRNQE